MRLKLILILGAVGALGWIAYSQWYQPHRQKKQKAQQLEEAFFQAVLRGDVNQAQRLLDAGVDINATDKYGRTAFEIAASQGWAEMTAMLRAHSTKTRRISQTHRRVRVRRST